MTVTAQCLSSQPGSFSPAFPVPIGAQQSLDTPKAQGFRPSIWLQPADALQTSDGIPTPHGPSSWIPVHAGFGATFAGLVDLLADGRDAAAEEDKSWREDLGERIPGSESWSR